MPDDAGAFPAVDWKRERATFAVGPIDETLPAPAALVFPFYGDRIALADIPDRGWCIPSGHREPGESAEAAVRREALEEAGVILGRVVALGHFILTDRETGAVRQAPAFVGDVVGLVDLPEATESRGRFLANQEDVAAHYFAWDALLAAVFAYAATVRERELRPGVSLAALREEKTQ